MIIDEAHLLKDNKVYEGIRRGQTLLKNPSLYYISTSGEDLSVPFFSECEYASKILSGEEINERYFVYYAQQDSDAEIHQPETWIKSNPLIEDDEIAETIIENLKEEVAEGITKGELNSLLVKSFNLWRQGSKDTYIQFQDWEACYTDSELDITGRDVYFGIDLSRQDDMSAVGIIFPLEDKKLFVDSHIFLGFKHSIAEKSQRDKIDYMKLIDTDMATLTNTESGIINYEQIIEWLIEYIESNNLNVKGIMYDPWSANSLVAKLEADTDYPLIEVAQNYKNLSPALKQFKLDVFEKLILHNGNPNLNLAINNAITKSDNNGNIILDKQTNRNKIDPIVALTTGYTMAMHYEWDNGMEDYIMGPNFGF